MKYIAILLLLIHSLCYSACGLHIPFPMPIAEAPTPTTDAASHKAKLIYTGLNINTQPEGGALLPFREIKGTVTRIWDGDTVTLDTGSHSYRIRIAGIDAPEHDQPFGRQASHCLRYLVLDKAVTAHIYTKDKYQRYVARLYLPEIPESTPPSSVFPAGADVGLLLLSKGMAWHYFYFDKDNPYYDTYRKAQRQAELEYKGLWQQQNPTPPWSYRNEKTAA